MGLEEFRKIASFEGLKQAACAYAQDNRIGLWSQNLTLQPIFHLYIPQKDLARLTSNIKYILYLQNRIVMFCLELWYSAEKYSTRCSHSAVSMGNNIFPNGIMKLL